VAKTFNVCDYRPSGDSGPTDTDAFAAAIRDCREAGGGTVRVPPGEYLTAPIRFVDGMTLHVEQGAVVRFSRDFDDYPMVRIRRMGVDVFGRSPQLYADEARDVAVTGAGTLDGQGEAWRYVKRFKLTDAEWDALTSGGGFVAEYRDELTWWPTEKAFRGKPIYDKLVARIQRGEQPGVEEYAGTEDYLRSPLLQFYRCRNVLLDGPTFSNSPFWNTHLVYCTGATVRNCRFRNPWNAQNGDGLDIDSCREVEVRQCDFAVGDDAICIKSGRDEDGWRAGAASEDIRIADCRVTQGHGGITIGSEMSGGVHRVRVQRCELENVQAGISLKSALGRGGVVEDVEIREITMRRIKREVVRINLQYAINDPALASRTKTPPVLRRLTFADIRCDGAGRAILLDGLAEQPPEEVVIRNAHITAEKGAYLSHGKDLCLEGVRLAISDGAGLTCQNVEGLALRDFSAGRA